MSKVIYACSRNRSFELSDKRRLAAICRALEPDNLVSPPEHRVWAADRVAWAVMGSGPTLEDRGGSLLLGRLYGEAADWSEPLADRPDGSFVVVRENAEFVEVVSDPAASRTVWYHLNDELFVASTSQRALAMYLRRFEFDERVVPWLLSTGSLGPEYSWDRRFRRLPPDSSVILDRGSWSLEARQAAVRFSERKRSEEEHRRLLEEEIRRTIATLGDLDFGDWVLPLSGGCDSRAILCFLVGDGLAGAKPSTITWGLERSIDEPGNDAYIARKLAAALDVKHQYFHTDLSNEPIGRLVDRFLSCGEGRIDQLSAYMDGMQIWRELNASRVVGIIRGDEGFGWSSVTSEMTLRYSVGCALCADFANLAEVIEQFGLASQDVPAELLRGEGESLAAWRDRLYHVYRLPTVLAALSDIKFAYVEQINPLLARPILQRVRELPDRLRTNKVLFRTIVDAAAPTIPYADKPAIFTPKDLLRRPELIDWVSKELRSETAHGLFRQDFRDFIAAHMATGEVAVRSDGRSFKQALKRRLPRHFIKNLLRDSGVSSLRVDGNVLAFRVAIAVRMHRMLTEDSSRVG